MLKRGNKAKDTMLFHSKIYREKSDNHPKKKIATSEAAEVAANKPQLM